MAIESPTLDLLACCLEYPEAHTASRARQAAAELASHHPETARALWDLAVLLENAMVGEAEERYTALFDMSPVCTLHVGYHMFGETYARGEFLASLGVELRQAGVSANGDLPDFLPNVVRLLGRLSPEDGRDLREAALLPALERMGAALAASQDPWSCLLRALPAALAEEGDVPVEAPRPANTRAALSMR